jgi:hypothetical protein
MLIQSTTMPSASPELRPSLSTPSGGGAPCLFGLRAGAAVAGSPGGIPMEPAGAATGALVVLTRLRWRPESE